MGRLSRETGEIHAKIVYCGPQGSGKTANTKFIYRKLKREHRGELRTAYARKDKNAPYEFLPVSLGAVRGFETSIHLHTWPGGDAFSDERRQVLEGVDGVVFVADLRPERHEATVAALDELRGHLQSYGRSFDDVLLVIQYNRRDEADESNLESLHAQLGVKPQAYFEGIATEGTGVLQCLTTLSKAILSRLRREADEQERQEAEAPAPPPDAASEPAPPPPSQAGSPSSLAFTIEPAGPPEGSGSELSIPLRLVDRESGTSVELSVRVTLAS